MIKCIGILTAGFLMTLLFLIYKVRSVIEYEAFIPYEFRMVGLSSWDETDSIDFDLDTDYSGSTIFIKGYDIQIIDYYHRGIHAGKFLHKGTISNGSIIFEGYTMPTMSIIEDHDGNIVCYRNNKQVLKMYRK